MLYAPQFKQNLLSISQFTTDNDCVFKFDKNGFLITNREHGILLAEGKRAESLYQLAPTKQVALFSNRQTKVDAHTWNYRLGHCSPKTFDILLREMDLSKRTRPSLVLPSICQSCRLGKSKRLPFTSSENRSSNACT